MTRPDQIRQVYQRYVELVSAGKADDVAILYAEDASVEDPIGTPLHQGRAAIRNFYAAASGAVRLELTGPVRVAGSEAAAPMLATISGADGSKAYIDIIDVMKFGEDGKIIQMRAFWSPDAIRKRPKGARSEPQASEGGPLQGQGVIV